MSLLDDGSITCWGLNRSGQLTVPVFPAGRRVTQISAGRFHSMALLDDGSVRCWGDDDHGQSTVPVFPAGRRVTQISAGDFYSMTLLDDGSVTCWGDNRHGQSTVPPDLLTVIHVAAAPAPTPLVQDTTAYREALAGRLTCPICYERERNTVLNCGHLFCAEDTTLIRARPDPKCPLCQTPITSAQKIFYGGYRQKYLKYKAKYLELKNNL